MTQTAELEATMTPSDPEFQATRPLADLLKLVPERDKAELRAACDVVADLAPTVELLGLAFDRFRLARELIDAKLVEAGCNLADRFAVNETFERPVNPVLDVLSAVERVYYRAGI